MKATRILAGAIEAGRIVAKTARRLHRTRDAVVFCVALACAWAAAQIDDPAPAVTVAVASR